MAKQSYMSDIQTSLDVAIDKWREDERQEQEREQRRLEGVAPPIDPRTLPSGLHPQVEERQRHWHDERVATFCTRNHWWVEAFPGGGSQLERDLAKLSPAPRLDVRIKRLEALRDWMAVDPYLGRFADTALGQQVKAVERRQRIFSIGIGVVSLIVGWLLSAISPAHLVFR